MKFHKWEQVDLDKVHSEHIKPNARLRCNEMHGHGPDCAKYDHEVYRLMDNMKCELRFLRRKLEKIKEEATLES